MQQKTERFEMRFEQATLDAIDEWTKTQDERYSKAEAIRRLIELGLSVDTKARHFTISDGERLTLFMLCDVYKHLKVKGAGVDPDFVSSALSGGHYWGLRWQYPGIFPDSADHPEHVNEVLAILDVWDMIELAIESMSKKDKDRVAKEVGGRTAFPGFDGNNESEHLHITNFLINDLDRFSRFKKRDLNSHGPGLEGYLRMTRAFVPIRADLSGRKMTVDEIIKVLNARDSSAAK